MKKFLCAVLVVMCLVGVVWAKEWYDGGTLTDASVGAWRKADYANKLATCGNFLASLWMNKQLTIKIASMDELKYYANELVDFIDAAVKGVKGINNHKVAEYAAMGVVMMEWTK